jgi:hypothetical protein
LYGVVAAPSIGDTSLSKDWMFMNAPTRYTPQQDFDVGSLYAGTYVKADDLSGNTYSATVTAVERVEIPEDDGSTRPKAAVTLQGWPAKLLLNKTNFETIAAAYGRQSAGWLGKTIEVYPDTTLFGGRSVPCVRVRVPRPAAPVSAVPGGTSPPLVALPAAAAPGPTPAPLSPPTSPLGAMVGDIPYN